MLITFVCTRVVVMVYVSTLPGLELRPLGRSARSRSLTDFDIPIPSVELLKIIKTKIPFR
jgi:hypothetical protein